MSAIADRIITLERGHNFRDLGGYRAADGRRVRRGMIFRSGTMADLTDSDAARLTGLGIVCICDLRTTSERAKHPTRWHDPARVEVVARDYDHSAGSLGSLAMGDGAAVRARMISLYRTLHEEQREAHGALFARLLAGDVPLLFNCAAGKDRTGVAAALILTALGVPRETVVEDYALSDHFADPLFDLLCRNPRYGLTPETPREAWLPMTRALPEYIETTLDTLTEQYGGVEAYLDRELGLGPSARERLRDSLLE